MTLFLRTTIILLLLLAIWNPNLPWGKADTDVFLLLDDSYSMEGKLTPKLWRQVRRQLQALPGTSQLALIRYGKQPVPEVPLTPIDQLETTSFASDQPPRSMPLDRTASNLEKAVSFALRQLKPEHKTTLMIIHDDQQNEGNAAELIENFKQSGHTLFQLNLADTEIKADAWIETLRVPIYAEPGQQLPVSVKLGSNTSLAAELTVRVNGKQSHRQSLQLEANRLQALPLHIETCREDVCIISAELTTEPDDAVPQNNKRQEAVTIDSVKPTLYLHRKQLPPPFLSSLQAGRYAVKTLTPDLCISAASELLSYQTIVIDDLAIADMHPSCWSAIDQSVRQQGTGLIVLGGSNSFSAGAYRHSLLETLLPVTAEASGQQDNAVLLFLVDKSGSMDSGATSRIAIARQAVIETLKSQSGEDRFGLISFDAQPHLTIPIRHYSDPAAVVTETFNSQATGGTRLKPALDFAVENLKTVDSRKRLLVLVTDGFLDEQDLVSVEQQLAAQDIEIIVMAIGNDARTENLQRLTDKGRGKLLHVDKIAELPLLMRKTLDEERMPAIVGDIEVVPVKSLPFMQTGTIWPSLSGYMLTRPKPESTVYLHSRQGDPLLITANVGQGKVVALPAGLDGWAENMWSNWSEWSRFAGGLIEWSHANIHHPQIQASLPQPNVLELNVISANQDWLDLDSGHLVIGQPNGQIISESLQLKAPGQYINTLAFQTPGLHKISVTLGEMSSSMNVFYNATEEYIPNSNNPKLSQTNLIPSWDASTELPIEHKTPNQARLLLPAIALILYLMLLVMNKSR